ncbi:MAG TPA: T9SS type A sorting domain-containing protein [Chitinophagales bacterium]|nr:T9SS type A sorting domain-containing protein [Chitinophagales bacterium]
MRTLSSIIIISVLSATAFAQAGQLDNTFSGDGKVKTPFPFGGSYGSVSTMTIQPDGKILIGGTTPNASSYHKSFISRYNTDGTVDISIGLGGNEDCEVFSLAVQQDGKIVVVQRFAEGYNLARYTSSGLLDPFALNYQYYSFGETTAALQADGKIVVGGFMYGDEGFMLLRYDSTGLFDTSFSSNGIVSTLIGSESGIYAVAIQSDNKIVAGGYTQTGNNTDWALVRYNSNGTLDSSFGIQGIVTTAMSNTAINAIAIQPDGKILVSAPGTFTLVRYNSDGSLDTTFGTNGIATDSTFESTGSFALQVDGKIVATGATLNLPDDFALIVLNEDGSIDSSFGTNGVTTTDFDNEIDKAICVAIEPDGKIVIAGGSDSRIELARYLSELNVGILNFSLSQSSPLIYPNPIHQTETLEYTLTKNESLTMTLYDVNGKLIKNFISSEQRAVGAHKETLNIGELTSGNYFLTISNGTQKMTVKMVNQ